jgi:eukaryotic-like serine/threonine-protein kinase
VPGPRAPWWMYVIAASFLAFFALLSYYDLFGPDVSGVSFGFPFEDRKGRLISAPMSPALERAGAKPGDYLVRLDGQQLYTVSDWFAIAANLEVGRQVRLGIERGGRQFEVEATFERHQMLESIYQVGVLASHASQILILVVSLFIAFSRPRNLSARLGSLQLAAGAALPLYLLPTGAAVGWRHLPALAGALLWFPCIARFVFSSLFCTFCGVFPRRLFRARWPWAIIWAPALLSVPSDIRYTFAMVYQPTHTTAVVPGWMMRTQFPLAAAYVAAGFVMLVLHYRRLEDLNERRRLRVLLVGSAVSSVLLTPLFVSVPGGFGPTPSRLFLSAPYLVAAYSLTLACPLSFAYAILRHRLFDIRVIIRRGLQYALARRVLLSSVPALGLILLGDLLLHRQPLVEVLRLRGWMYGALGGLAVVAQARRQQWLTTLDRHFFRERYDAQRLLREVAEGIREAKGLEQVALPLVARIETAMHPEFVALLIREPEAASFRSVAAAPGGQAPPPLAADSKLMSLVRVLGKAIELPSEESGWPLQQLPPEEIDYLRAARIDLLVPIASGRDRREALLALGVKRSEEPYAREDQDLLMAIAASLALLLHKSVATVPAQVINGFEECAQCGACYDASTGHCPKDGSALTSIHIPRLLAGRYRLEHRLGRGGMGTVYEATDGALGRRVAVKLIREDLVGQPDAAQRFRREAQVAASFAHPNVVTVFDFGLEGSHAFLVMELLEGTNLREEIRSRGRLVPVRTLEIMRGVCAAVEAAHQRHLIHRDLKPENVFLARAQTREIPKVLDFGLAKFLHTGAAAIPNAPTATAVETGVGVLIGTLQYMAPEQLAGGTPQPAWDLWALAVLAYEMLTGTHPFDSARPDWHRALVAGSFTPIAAYFPESPPRLTEFIAGALALDPKRRPDSARSFFLELDRALA